MIMPTTLFAFFAYCFIFFFDSLIYMLLKVKLSVFINKNSQVFFYLYTLKLPAIHKIF